MAYRIPRRAFEVMCGRRLPRGMLDAWFVQSPRDGDYDRYWGNKGSVVMVRPGNVRSGNPECIFSSVGYRQV